MEANTSSGVNIDNQEPIEEEKALQNDQNVEISLLSSDHQVTQEETVEGATNIKETRQAWGNYLSFILATVGASVGFGNMLRFPSILYRSGGGAFLIPFFIAAITVGYPVAMAEVELGKKTQKSPILAYQHVHKRAGGVGAAAVLMSFFTMTYYTVFLDWMFVYFFYTLRAELPWVGNPEEFFFKVVLNASSGPAEITGISWKVLLGHIATWACIYLCVFRGTKSSGIISYLSVPLPLFLVTVLLIRSLFLEGAWEGIRYFLQPNFEHLLYPSVWMSAFGQILFSLGIGLGVLTALSSYSKGKDAVRDGVLVTSIDISFTIYSGISVFALLGHLAHTLDKDVGEVSRSGIALAFITFPQIVSYLPLPHLFAILLWITLFTLGIDSAFAFLETVSSVFHDWFPKIPIPLLNFILCVIGFLMGIPYVFSNGIYLMNIVDHFVGSYCILILAICECIVFGYFAARKSLLSKLRERPEGNNVVIHFLKNTIFHSIDDYRNDMKKNSKFGPFIDFNIWVKYVAPIALAVVLVNGFIGEIIKPFSSNDAEGLDVVALVIGLIIVLSCLSVILFFIIFPICHHKSRRAEEDSQEMNEEEKFEQIKNDDLKAPLFDHVEQENNAEPPIRNENISSGLDVTEH